MSTVVDCPSCRRKLRVPGEFLGKSVRCPSCGDTFEAAETMPGPAPAASGPSSTPTGPSPLVTVPLKLELDDPAAAKPVAKEEPPNESPPPRRLDRESEKADDRDDRRRRRSLRRDFEPCPRCGDDIRRGAVVCPFCGLDLEEQGDGYTRRARVRRDAEPHRGGTIQVLGILSLMGGVFYCLFPIGLPLGIVAWVMARRDLRKMDAGVMDPNGRKKTRDGRVCGIVGTVLNGGCALLALVVFFVIVLAESHSTPPIKPNAPVWQNNPPGWQNAQPVPQVNNFTLRVLQPVVTLKRGETKTIVIMIDRVAGWGGNITVAPAEMEGDGLDVNPDEVKVAKGQQSATFRVTAEKDAAFGEQVIHFSATTDAGEDVRLDVRVNVVRGR
jgi:hypothetical protein